MLDDGVAFAGLAGQVELVRRGEVSARAPSLGRPTSAAGCPGRMQSSTARPG
jgi:hypothetical protein